jgi:hypothetical protein
MKNFLKEFWLWILVPFVLVLGLLALLFVVSLLHLLHPNL